MLYSLFIHLYVAAIRLASLWNAKARSWSAGRKDWRSGLQAIRNKAGDRPILWIHCASLGEFEQGRPVIEALRAQHPTSFILLTFFSPSGYEVRKDYAVADAVCYLPADTPANARFFVQTLRPALAIFVKYEYWLNLLAELRDRQVPVLMISAIFRENQVFFSWYGTAWRKALAGISHFFLQDGDSADRLNELGIHHHTVAGDTRFDRVLQLAAAFSEIPEIASFCGNQQVLVAGSTWPEDEAIIAACLRARPDLKCILAPHEIHAAHLDHISNVMPDAIRFSVWKKEASPAARVLVIDNIGMLSRLYHYATVTYIGGGFGKGIHNTLEAAVYGKPVLFGPHYQKFREARELIREGAAWSIQQEDGMIIKMQELLDQPSARESSGLAAGNYVRAQAGATQKIMQYIQENRLLTR